MGGSAGVRGAQRADTRDTRMVWGPGWGEGLPRWMRRDCAERHSPRALLAALPPRSLEAACRLRMHHALPSLATHWVAQAPSPPAPPSHLPGWPSRSPRPQRCCTRVGQSRRAAAGRRGRRRECVQGASVLREHLWAGGQMHRQGGEGGASAWRSEVTPRRAGWPNCTGAHPRVERSQTLTPSDVMAPTS